MSDETLKLILDRLDTLDKRQIAFEHRQESFEHRQEAFEHRREAFERRREAFERRQEAFEQRLDRMEREQTRLRTDLMGQMERVLVAMQEVRDDVTMAVNHATRADAALGPTTSLQRSMQSQLSRLRDRGDRLEGGQSQPEA